MGQIAAGLSVYFAAARAHMIALRPYLLICD
jgi:hypothetical protein